MSNLRLEKQLEIEEAETQIRRMSRRSFLWAGAATLDGFSGLKWLNSRRTEDGIVWPLRRVLEANGEISRDLFNSSRLAPEFASSRAVMPRVNGKYGLSDDFDATTWSLMVSGLASGEDREFSLAEIKKLPKFETTTELKCIEGWAAVVHWGGVRLADFIAKYPPAASSSYVGLATPDGGYFVGLDMESALHPQTLLCFEMDGKPLTSEHGAPLRLVVPVKYGIKNIKRIGSISYSALRPQDYWAQRGYDWYAGL